MRRLTPFLLPLLAACGSSAPAPAPSDAGATLDAGSRDAASPDDPTCAPSFGQIDACGGDLVGTWTYASACSDESPVSGFQATCTGARASSVAYTTSGTLTVRSDGTFTRTTHDQTSGTLDVPEGCATLAGGCAGLPDLLRSAIRDSTASCSAISGGCTCSVTVVTDTNDTGTWEAGQGAVTINNGDRQLMYYYCVGNGVLKYRGIEDNPDRISYVLTE